MNLSSAGFSEVMHELLTLELVTVKSRKLLLPSIAALPLLMAYAGHTTILIPKPLVPYVGHDILDLGILLIPSPCPPRKINPLTRFFIRVVNIQKKKKS